MPSTLVSSAKQETYEWWQFLLKSFAYQEKQGAKDSALWDYYRPRMRVGQI